MSKSGTRKNYVKTEKFRPGGEKGKLHRELGIKEDKKIPSGRLEAASHSRNPEIRRDAIRAKTMKGWNHGGKQHAIKLMYGRSGD